MDIIQIEHNDELYAEDTELLLCCFYVSHNIGNMYFVENQYIQKLLLGSPISDFSVLIEKMNIKKLLSIKIRSKKYDCYVSAMEKFSDEMKHIEFNWFNPEVIKWNFEAIFILLNNNEKDLVISKVKFETYYNMEVIIPKDKYFVEHYKKFNILCIITDDNIVSKDDFNINKLITYEYKQPEYVTKIKNDVIYRVGIFSSENISIGKIDTWCISIKK